MEKKKVTPKKNVAPKPQPVDDRPSLCPSCKYFKNLKGQAKAQSGVLIGFEMVQCSLWNWGFIGEDLAVECPHFEDMANGQMIDLNPIHNRMDSYEKVEEELIDRLERLEKGVPLPIPPSVELRGDSGETAGIHIDNATFNMKS